MKKKCFIEKNTENPLILLIKKCKSMCFISISESEYNDVLNHILQSLELFLPKY